MNSRPLLRRAAALALAFAALPSLASAHSVWIETLEAKSLIVRFGDPGDEIESSPGALDKLVLPLAWNPVAAGAKIAELPVAKKTDGFLLEQTTPEKSTLIETTFPVMARAAKDDKPAQARLPRFYARWHTPGAAAAPSATLDLVPGTEAGQAKVFFRGKPLAGAKVRLIPPSGEPVALTSDENGLVKFTPSGKGLHVLLCPGHSEVVSGYYLGEAYDVVSHNASLAWIQP